MARFTRVSSAVNFASGLATGLRAYLERMAALPDERPRPYAGGRRLTDLYVEPDVLRWERRTEREPSRAVESERDDRLLRAGAPRAQFAPETRDTGEQPYGELREEEIEWRRSWTEARRESEASANRRCVVLAPPGQGKSLLAQMTAREVARNALELLDGQSTGVDALPLPIVVPLNTLTEGLAAHVSPDKAVRMRLRAVLEGLLYGAAERENIGRSLEYLVKHAHEERVLLILDGLDEVIDEEGLWAVLHVVSGWRCRVVLTSRPYGYEGRNLPFDVVEYRLSPFSSGQVRAFVERWFQGEEGEMRLKQLLATSPAVQQLGQNPFLLTLVCWVVEWHELPDDITRTQLYGRVIRDVLGLSRGGTDPVNEQRAVEWLPLLGELALAWFRESGGRRPMSSKSLLTRIEKSKKRPALLGQTAEQTEHMTPWQQASYLVDELREKRLLVQVSAERAAYDVPHKSFLEYLTAWELAGKLESGSRRVSRTASNTVDEAAGDSGWQEVILFLAGELDEPERLLGPLANEARDVPAHYRLCLAARCLAEIRVPPPGSPLATLLDEISEETFSLWLTHETSSRRHATDRTEVTPMHLRQSLPALVQANRRFKGVPLLEWILGQLAAGDSDARISAAATLGELGAAAAEHHGVIATLLENLWNRDGHVRFLAVVELGRIGPAAAAHPDVLPALVVELLDDGDAYVRFYAAWSLACIGEEAAEHPKVLPGLLRSLLSDTQSGREAGLALGEMKQAAARHPDVIPGLVSAFRGRSDFEQRRAAEGLGWIGELAACHAEVLPALAERLGDRDPQAREVRREAARTLGRMAKAAASRADVVELLAACVLHDLHSHSIDRPAAAWALSQMGEAASRHDELLPSLVTALRDENWVARYEAAWALARMGDAAAQHPAVLPALAANLRHHLQDVRRLAIEPLIRMVTSVTLHPQIVAALREVMSDPEADDWVREQLESAFSDIAVR